MKKTFILFLALIALLDLNAQEDKIRFGAKAGLNISNISGSEIEFIEFIGDVNNNYNSIVGFHIGGLVEVPITEKFAIQPELLFSTQGYETAIDYTFENSFFGISQNIVSKGISKVNYLNIPLMLKFYPKNGLSLQAGPQIGFPLSATEKLLSTTVNGEDASEFLDDEAFDESDAIDQYNAIDFGLNLGLGYQLELGLFFDLRYNIGLSNMIDISGFSEEELELSGIEDGFKISNRVLQLSVGYKF